MKHGILRICAYILMAAAGLVALAGIAATLLLGLSMTAVTARIAVMLAGFITTAVFAIILLAVSQLWLLFIRMEDDLAELAAASKSKPGD